MNKELVTKIEQKYKKSNMPDFKVGDTIDVGTIIREGEKKRTQRFKGVVIGIKGSGNSKTFTVRKISYGIGVEKIFPWNSTNISDVVILKHGKARRAKLNYLRKRVGKLALKVKQGRAGVEIENAEEAIAEEVPVEEGEENAVEEVAAETEVEAKE